MTRKIFARNVKDKFLLLKDSVPIAAVPMMSIFAIQVVQGLFSGYEETTADDESEGVREGRIVSIFSRKELEARYSKVILSQDKCKL